MRFALFAPSLIARVARSASPERDLPMFVGRTPRWRRTFHGFVQHDMGQIS
jgi:hypothetical protein